MSDIQQINNNQQMSDIQQIEQLLQFPELSYFDDCTLYQFGTENDAISINLIPTAIAIQEEIQPNSVFDYVMSDLSF